MSIDGAPFDQYVRPRTPNGIEPIEYISNSPKGAKGYRVGKWRGQDAHTNGHILLIGPPTLKGEFELLDTPFGHLPKAHTSLKKIQIIGFSTGHQKPIERMIYFSHRGVINAKFYDVIIKRFPQATFWGSTAGKPVFVRDGQKYVGLMMPLRPIDKHSNFPINIQPLLP